MHGETLKRGKMSLTGSLPCLWEIINPKSFIYIIWDCKGQGCGVFCGPRYVGSIQLGRM